jgi:hypothetical protein
MYFVFNLLQIALFAVVLGFADITVTNRATRSDWIIWMTLNSVLVLLIEWTTTHEKK